jgi:uncharacterized protein YndB with AHSA1/START domain
MSNVTVKRNDGELLISRLINAPRELVFEVWTDPKHTVHWWGPNGFTITNDSIEVKPGGTWQYMMHGPDGRDYPNRIVFIEVVKPERLVYKHAGDEDTEPVNFHVTVTFEEEDGKTRLTMKSIFASAVELDRVEKEYGAIEGGKQHVTRLNEYLATVQQSHSPFVIERILNAPVEKVWTAISSKEEMNNWYFKIAAFKLEVGFTFQFIGEGGNGEPYTHHCEIKEVVPMKKLSYTWRYEGIPGNSLVAFELFPEGNKTILKLTHTGLETFVTDNPDFRKESFVEGWTHIIGQSLPEYLEKA